MAESLIRWTKGDKIKLGKAIAQFNKKRNELISDENALYFPDEIEYQEAKRNITTRREFNRYINMIKRFQQEDATDLYTTKAGEQMTKWTRRELGRLASTVKRRATIELKKLNTAKLR